MERIEFTGWHSDLGPFINSLDLLVLPSLKESFGLVLIEAMAFGKPVITTACNGPASIVVDGETGYLLPVGDAGALADGLERAMLDPDRGSKGRAAYKRVLAQYIPQHAGEKLLDALRELGAKV